MRTHVTLYECWTDPFPWSNLHLVCRFIDTIYVYRIEGYFPEVQIFPNGEPLALAEIFPIQKFPNLVP